jgi:hypothetical protein
LFDSVAKKPLTTKTKRVATESLVVLGTASALYDSESGWPMLRVALKQAKMATVTCFFSLADAYTGRQPMAHIQPMKVILGLLLIVWIGMMQEQRTNCARCANL